MARMIVVIAAVLFVLASVSPAATNWSFNTFGNNDVVGVGLDYRPTERASIGVETAYFDGLKPETGTPGVSVKMVGKYYYSLQNEMDFGLFTVKADSYAGVGLGGKFIKDEKADDVADIRTGVEFGEDAIKLGFGYQYSMTDLMWSGDKNGEHMVLATISFKF